MDQIFWGNTMRAWTAAAALAVAVWLGLWVLKRFLIYQLRRIAGRTSTQIDDLVLDLLVRVRPLVLILLGLYAGSFVLDLPETRVRLLRSLAVLAILLQAAFWGNRLISYWLSEFVRKRGEVDAAGRTTISTLSFVGRIALWATLLLLALDNLGVKVTGLITGLGIGGIAVALAAQELLKDLFASLVIALDKPFLIGDMVQVGDLQGTVEQIGIKTTRVRSLSGEQLVFPNSDIVNSRLRNFGRMEERRVLLNLGLVYQTPPELVERATRLVRETIEANDGVRFDRSHFKAFGDSALVLEAVYFVQTADYLASMDLQQSINLEIFRRFAAEGIEFAYPTQKVFVQPITESAEHR
jgi:small-conductance mechanosensitive channel